MNFRLHSMRSGEGIEALRRKIVDVAFVHTVAEQDNDTTLDHALVHKDAFSLVVPEGHDLASAMSDVSPTILANEKWITLADS